LIKNNPILSISFRPFFILAALIAIINPSIWVLSYLGRVSIPLAVVDPLFWHGHEMIFGFTGALIAGFILTASANWTNSTPYQGKSLLLLVTCWLLERLSYFIFKSEHLQFLIMNLFFPVLSLMLLKKLWSFPKQRNVFMPIVFGISVAKILHSWGYLYSVDYLEESGREIAIGLIRFIILLIAGRVIPFFTRKKIEGININLPNWINPLSLIPVALIVIPWPEAVPRFVLGAILTLALIANVSRQALWKPWVTFNVPILYVLHIGIALINIELLMELIGLFSDQVYYTQSALHLLMAGGLGVVGIGIMTRVSLGHTGRIIRADLWTCLSYSAILMGSLIRVFVPIFFPDIYIRSLQFASGLWTLGFGIFIIKYFKILTTQRPDGKLY
jgi:uncharacterized protein involved in response to NO